MKFRSILIVILFALTSGVAIAGSCPKHMKAIDADLAKNPKITEAQMSDVKKYRADCETFHKAGNHADALEACGKAETILGIKM